MNKISFVILLLISLYACKKSETPKLNNPGNNPNPTTAYVKFKADGVQYQYNFGTSFLDNDVEQLGFSFNNGVSTNLQSIILIYDSPDQLGLRTFNINENNFNSIIFKRISTDLDNNEFFLFQTRRKGTATVTVTKMKLIPGAPDVYAINGTFSATLYNKNGASIQITEGEFFNPLTN